MVYVNLDCFTFQVHGMILNDCVYCIFKHDFLYEGKFSALKH